MRNSLSLKHRKFCYEFSVNVRLKANRGKWKREWEALKRGQE
jgi:hypothetical protein